MKIQICRGKTRKFVKLYMPFLEISKLYTFYTIEYKNLIKNKFLANHFKICCTLLPGHLFSYLHDRVFSLKFGKIKLGSIYVSLNQCFRYLKSFANLSKGLSQFRSLHLCKEDVTFGFNLLEKRN